MEVGVRSYFKPDAVTCLAVGSAGEGTVAEVADREATLKAVKGARLTAVDVQLTAVAVEVPLVSHTANLTAEAVASADGSLHGQDLSGRLRAWDTHRSVSLLLGWWPKALEGKHFLQEEHSGLGDAAPLVLSQFLQESMQGNRGAKGYKRVLGGCP